MSSQSSGVPYTIKDLWNDTKLRLGENPVVYYLCHTIFSSPRDHRSCSLPIEDYSPWVHAAVVAGLQSELQAGVERLSDCDSPRILFEDEEMERIVKRIAAAASRIQARHREEKKEKAAKHAAAVALAEADKSFWAFSLV